MSSVLLPMLCNALPAFFPDVKFCAYVLNVLYTISSPRMPAIISTIISVKKMMMLASLLGVR